LNELYEANINLRVKDVLNDIVKELVNYTAYHFATEEKYFDEFNYEYSVAHKEEHKALLAKVNDFEKRYAIEKEKIVPELVEFLENWLVHHLEVFDRQYVRCFHEHGLF